MKMYVESASVGSHHSGQPLSRGRSHPLFHRLSTAASDRCGGAWQPVHTHVRGDGTASKRIDAVVPAQPALLWAGRGVCGHWNHARCACGRPDWAGGRLGASSTQPSCQTRPARRLTLVSAHGVVGGDIGAVRDALHTGDANAAPVPPERSRPCWTKHTHRRQMAGPARRS